MKKYYENDNINDLYLDLIDNVTNSPEYEVSPRGMAIKEITNVVVTLTNPKNCLITLKDRKLNNAFAAVEKLEYLSGQTNPDRILNYNKNFGFCKNTYNYFDGAYANRLGYWYRHIYNLLKKDPDSRQAVATIYGPQDRHESKDIPCTLFHHYFIREGKLNMTAYMRSNDLLWGFPYDVNGFCFLLEAMASMLGVEMGTYTHVANSMHSYVEREEQITKLLTNSEKLDIVNPTLERMGFDEMYNNLNLFWVAEENLRKTGGTNHSLIANLPESFKQYYNILVQYNEKKKSK